MRAVAHIFVAVVLALIALVALVVGGALTALRTEAGADWVRRQALPRVNALIAGRLELGSFRYHGDELVLEHIVLDEPDGRVVARVEKLDVTFSPLALFRGRLDVKRLSITAPELTLRQDEAGLNLARALARGGGTTTTPPPASPASSGPASGGGLAVDLRRLDITRGVVDFRTSTPGADHHSHAVGVEAHGDAHFEGGPTTFSVALRVQADVTAPLSARAAVTLVGHGHGDVRDASVNLSVGSSAIDATAHTTGPADASLTIARLLISPELVRAFAPTTPLRAAIDLTGTARLHERALAFETSAHAGQGGIDAHGTIDLTRRWVRGMIRGHQLDLAEIFRGSPPSALGFSLHVDGGGSTLANVEGALSFEAPRGSVAGRPVGPISLRASADAQSYRIDALSAILAGLSIQAGGDSTAQHLGFRLTVDARDLSETMTMLPGELAEEVHASGSGHLSVQVNGTASRPELKIVGRFPRLAFANASGRALSIDLAVPDPRAPLTFIGNLSAGSLRVADTTLSGLSVAVREVGLRLNVAASLATPGPARLKVTGRWGDDHRSFTVDTLAAAFADTHWVQRGHARLVFEPSRLMAKGLDLRSGTQRLRLDFEKEGTRVRGGATVGNLDLAALPAVLMPTSAHPGGILDVEGKLAGTLDQPEVTAKVHLRDGRFQRYSGLSAALDLRYTRQRARGSVSGRGLGTAIQGTFDVPGSWPFPDPHAPLALQLEFGETDLATVLGAFDKTNVPVRGRAALSVHVTGRADAPALALHGNVQHLVIGEQTIGDATVTLDGGGGGTPATNARLEVSPPWANRASGSGVSFVTASVPLSPGQLVQRRDSPSLLWRTPVEMRGELTAIPIALLAQLAHSPERVSGTVSARLNARGPLRALEGAIDVKIVDATFRHLPATDARLDLAFGDRDVRAAATVSRSDHPASQLAWMNLVLKLPAPALADRNALSRAPLELHAGLGPLHVRRRDLPGALARQAPEDLEGRVRGALDVEGSLHSPRATTRLELLDWRIDGQPVGRADGTITYAARRAIAELHVASATGGFLQARATSNVELGFPQVTTEQLDPKTLPFEAKLTAQAFDMRWLAGLSPSVRDVGGALSALVTANGTATRPGVAGRLEWTNGRIGLADFGAYRNIHLALHGDEELITLDELSADSGEGHAQVTASARPRGGGGYGVKLGAALQRFPLYAQGSRIAAVGVDLAVDASLSPRAAEARVNVQDAHVELEDAKRKDLQSLDRPADIILFDQGKPADAAEARKLKGLLAARAGTAWPGRAGQRVLAIPAGPPPLIVQARINAPRNLWVKGKDANLELGLGPDFRVELAGEPRVYGEVLVKRGRIDVFGRRFDLQNDSTLRFDGQPQQPQLDVRAKYTNASANVTVILAATGTLDHLKVTVTSPDHPELTETQLYTLIVTGRLQFGGGNSAGSTSPSAEAASLLGGVVASQLQKALAKNLPLDVLTIQTGNGLTGSQLEAGTYVGDKLYVGYVGRVGADPALLENRNAAHLEYQLSRRWSFDGEYGDAGTGTADVIWTKHY